MSSNGNDLVSVIITTYYRDEPLRRAIENVLDQTYDPIEIIVVDDSGESYAEELVSEFESVEYVPHEENQGQIEAWHTGFAQAKGEFIQLHDDDDWIDSSKIEYQINEFYQEDVDIVFSNIKENNEKIISPEYDMCGSFLKQVLSHNSYPCQTTSMLIRSNILEDVFPLTYYPGGTDIVLQIELSQQANFHHLDEVLIYRDTTGESQGGSVDAYKSHLQLIDDYSGLYDKYPEEFELRVRAGRWRKLGHAHLRDHVWSFSAISSFSRAFHIHPGVSGEYLELLIASIFGKPGFFMGSLVKSVITREN